MTPVCFDMSHSSEIFSVIFQDHLICFLPSPRISYFSKGTSFLLLENGSRRKWFLVLTSTGVPPSLGFFSGSRMYLKHILDLEIQE